MTLAKPSRRSSGLVLIVGLLGVVLAGCSGANTQVQSGDGQGFVSGDMTTVVKVSDRVSAPEVAGPTLDGKQLSLSELRGDVVVLNVWGSWCAPCREEAKTLQAVYEETRAQGVRFVGINTRDQDVAARAFDSKFGVTYPSWVDPSGEMQLAFHDSLPPNAIPSTLVIDRQGKVAARILGPVTFAQLKGLVSDVAAQDG